MPPMLAISRNASALQMSTPSPLFCQISQLLVPAVRSHALSRSSLLHVAWRHQRRAACRVLTGYARDLPKSPFLSASPQL
jgi:hypothetical protein